MDLGSPAVGRRSKDEDEKKRDKVVNLEAGSVLDGVKSGGGDKNTTLGAEVVGVNANGEVAVDKGGGGGVGDLASLAKASVTTTKGKGLKKKWRRIERETTTEEGTSAVGPDRKLKRGLSNSESASKPPPRDVVEEKPKSAEAAESSVASATAADADDFRKLDPELEILVTETRFSLGWFDSDNNEDRSSSKSSTAASGARQRPEVGFGRERSRGRGGGHGGLVLLQHQHQHQQQHRGMRGRGGEASKKSRPDRFVHGGRDLSRSSVESEVRSSNAVAVQVGSTSSNGEHSRGSVNYEGEGVRFRGQAGEDLGDGFFKQDGVGNEGEVVGEMVDDGNHERKKKEREENDSFRLRGDRDPFLEPLDLLQAAQEALEREVQRFEEFETELQSEENEVISSPSLSSNLDPSGLVEHAKSTLPKESVLAKSTESRDLDYAATTGVYQSPGKGLEGTYPPPQFQDKHEEVELQLEDTLKSKLELEVECVTLRRIIQLWKVAMEEQHTHSEEQKSILADYQKLTARLSDSENRAAELEAQARELQASYQKSVGNDEPWILQNRAVCLLMQLVLLFVALWFFVIHLIPSSSDYVPT